MTVESGSDGGDPPHLATSADAGGVAPPSEPTYEILPGVVGEWSPLLLSDWTLSAGTEGYVCVVAEVPEDIWMGGFRSPLVDGLHHATLGVADADYAERVGRFDCDGFNVGAELLAGVGVGTEPFLFPDGVAVKLEAGTKLLLNLHLYNTSSADLSGVSGIEVLRAPPADAAHEAKYVLMGKAFGLEVPPGESTQAGACTVPSNTTIFGMAPHMHQTGSYLKVTAQTPAGPVVLHDEPYDFAEQLFHPVAPEVSVAAGSVIDVECTYQNGTGLTLAFGESSDDEMCYAGAFHYPPVGFGSVCIF